MKNIPFKIILLLSCFITINAGATKRSDSLWITVAKKNNIYTAADTLTADLLSGYARKYRKKGVPDSAYMFAKKALEVAEQLSVSADPAVALAALKQMAFAHNHLGNIADTRGQSTEALKQFYASLKIKEKIKDENGIAVTIHNIALIYSNNGNNEEALKNYLRAAEINKRIFNYMNLCKNYHNIANIYDEYKDFSKALEYYEMSLKIKRDIKDENGISTTLCNIGLVKDKLGLNEEAMKYYREALAIAQKNNFKKGIITCYINISVPLINIGKARETDKMLNDGITIATEMQEVEALKSLYLNRSQCDSALGNFPSAYSNYKKYTQIKEQLRNEEVSKELVRMQLQHDFDKKEQEQKAEQAKKDAIAAEKLNTQQTRSNYLIIGLLLMTVAIIFIYRNYREKKKINKELQIKNVIIEQKQNEIMDSIHYASRIQRALVTSEKNIEKQINKLSSE